MTRPSNIVLAVLLPLTAANAEPTHVTAHVGDTYEIVRVSVSQTTGGQSSGASHDKDTLVERVIGVREDGLELEYDLPKSATAEDRTRNWQFPVRVLKPTGGQMQLLNAPELEARVDGWLKRGNLPRSACGHWIFTWNVFRIECDPQSVIQMLAPFDLRPDLRNGATYKDTSASAPVELSQVSAEPTGSVFVVEMVIDPDVVRREDAQSDLAVAEISKKSLTLEAALLARSSDQISGKIAISFETDSAGQLRRPTKVTKIKIIEVNGKSDARTTTETVERRMLHD